MQKYSDLSFFLSANRYTKDFNLTTGKISLLNCIKNIILTEKNHRPFDSFFGSNAYKYLFSSDNSSLTDLSFSIVDAIRLSEPRVDPDTIDVTIENTIKNKINLNVKLNLIDDPDTITFNITL